MKKPLLILFTVLTAVLLCSSCNYYRNAFTFGNTGKDFLKSLVSKDYNKCIGLFQLPKRPDPKKYQDTIKSGLAFFHSDLAKFGNDPSYAYVKTLDKGTLTSIPVPNSTSIVLQISNSEQVGLIEALFDNKSEKILSIQLLKTYPKPDRTNYWLMAIVCLIVLAFNIYTLRKVKRSNMANKWPSYLLIVLLNICAIGYSPARGLYFDLFSVEPFFGIWFDKLGYADSAWIFGIPAGAIYVLRQLRTGNYERIKKVPKHQANK